MLTEKQRTEKYRHLTIEEKERLFKWFKSQERWHKSRPKTAWHIRQSRWYKKKAQWLFTYDEIVSRTLRKYSRLLAENLRILSRLTK